jgi:hypothetical protein
MRSPWLALAVLVWAGFCHQADSLAAGAASQDPPPAEPNTLSAEEKAAGWRLLFDGQTTTGWRGFKRDSFPDRGWAIEQGTLVKQPRIRGGDIITTETFLDFELSWEWRIHPGGNNGVKYLVIEERTSGIGHEYQMIDDSQVRDPKGTTASFYGVLPTAANKPLPRIDHWNQSRIVVQGQRVEHWLNDVKVLEYELGSPAVLAAVAKSKFKDVPGFGTKLRGHILLTDHTDEAHYRSLKIRELTP